MSKLLSICIPTYNRAYYLSDCVKSILDSMEGNEEKVEIIVSDNASTDSTPLIMKEFSSKNKEIEYYRNTENIGAEKNFYKAASLAHGKYLWILGDDDKIAFDSIPKFLDLLEANYDLIISNFSVWSKDFSFLKKTRAISLKVNRVFNTPNEVLKTLGIQLGYISITLIKSSIFFKIPWPEYERFIEYGLPHLLAIYSGLTPNCYACYIAEPLIMNRANNSGGFDWYKYFVIGSSLIFEALLKKGYADSAIRIAKHQVLKDFVIPQIFFMKLEKYPQNIKVLRLLLKYYKQDPLFWLAGIPVFCIPSFVVKLMKKVWIRWRMLKNRINLHRSLNAY